MRKFKKLISMLLSVCMLAALVPNMALAAEELKPKTIDDYPDEAYVLDVENKKMVEAVEGLSQSKKIVNKGEHSAEWKLSDQRIIKFEAIKDVSGFETIEFYLYGDQDHPVTLKFTIGAENKDTEGSDYYDAGNIEVKPGWNKYIFSLSTIKGKSNRIPRKLYDIDSFCFYSSGWSLEKTNDFSAVLYFDSIILRKGEAMIDRIPVIKPETEAGTVKYFEYDFEADKKEDVPGISYSAKSNKMDIVKEGKNRYLQITGQGTQDDCFITIPVEYTRRYMVLQCDVKFTKPNRSSNFFFGDGSNVRSELLGVTKDKNIVSGGTVVGKTEDEKWFNLAICADNTSHVVNVYIDGKQVGKNLPMTRDDMGRVTHVRIFVGRGSTTVIGIDNLKLYDGKTPDDYKKAVDAPSPDVKNDFGEDIKVIDVNTKEVPKYKQVKSNAVKEVANAVCLKVNSPFALVYHEQVPIDANNKEVAPFVINGRTLVPVRFIAEAFGAEVGWDADTKTVTVKKESDTLSLSIGSDVLTKNGKEIKIDVPAEIYNDRTMLPLRAVTENLGKKVFWDDMGLIIISDEEFNFTKTNEKDLEKMLDIMAGFIYERPGQAKLKEDLLKTAPDHPRVLVNASDFDRIRNLYATDANMKKWVDEQIKTADKMVASAPTEGEHTYAADSGGRLDNNYSIILKATSMGIAYQITGDKKYPEALWLTLKDMCAWEHWHPGHFLNTADIMHGVSIAYDWMYDAWSDEQKTIIEEALYDNGIKDSITAYHGANDYLSPPMGVWQRSQWWPQGSNWNAHCNGGVMLAGIALATHEKYGDLAIKAMDYALNGIEVGLRCYAPDGGYEEGPSYWGYGTNSAIFLMAGLKCATGSNYGLTDAPGFEDTYTTPLHLESKQGLFNYSDSEPSRTNTTALFWFGLEYNNPQINGVRLSELLSGEKIADYTDILWYRPENVDRNANLELDYTFHLIDTMSMRSSWTDENQIYVGFHGAENNAAHGHLDAGTFVLDAMGERWFIDVGKDNYNLPGYFGSTQRYLYYATRAEGHNTVIVNPGTSDFDQEVYAAAKVEKFVTKPRGAFGIIDMTQVHSPNAESAKRGIMLAANRKAVIIQDEMTIREPSEFYWFAHTKEDIEIAPDGRSAILTSKAKKLHVQIVSDNADLKFGVMDADYLPTSPARPESKTEKELSREGIRKLYIHGKGTPKVNLAVVCQPYVAEGAAYTYTYTPLDKWNITDGEIVKPQLYDLKVDGETVKAFESGKTGYEILYPFGTTRVPEVSATPDEASDINITLPSELPGTATVKVYNKEDPSMYTVYTVMLKVAKELELIASGFQPGNDPENCLDKNLATRWAVEGESNGIFMFSVPKTISSVWLASWKSDARKLLFDIEVSVDGENFNKVWSGQTTTNKDELEEFKIPEGTYKAVKLVFHGTTAGAWNSILEVEFK